MEEVRSRDCERPTVAGEGCVNERGMPVGETTGSSAAECQRQAERVLEGEGISDCTTAAVAGMRIVNCGTRSEGTTEVGVLRGGFGLSGEAEQEVRTSLSYKKRKRGKEGPPSCQSATTNDALGKAVASSKERSGDPVFYPYVGTTFASFEEAKNFYNVYSWEIGFGIREGRAKTNANGYTTRKDLLCSCEGLCSNPRAASIRTGCKAMLRLHRTENHSWVVTTIISDHNHPLSVTCGEKKQWASHGYIDPMTKEFVKRLRRNNVPLGRVCSIVGVLSTDSAVSVRKQSVRNLCAKLAQEDIEGDMEKTIALLKQMKDQDEELEVRFKTDGNNKIEAMLWCTGKNKKDYAHFGDVITFDTTYRTNLYNLPFGIFVGVNNHYQSIIFGGVLLKRERTTDFEWTFSNFIEIMGGKKPETILTDQCQAMGAAIKTTMPGTRHRWCRWHVLRKAKQKIGTPYSKKSGFKKKFNRLITDEVSAAAFEEQWVKLVKEYKLEGNKFMDRAYKMRGMWAKPYFMDIFCAGMTSTQRSESANHMLKRFIQRSAPMHLFVSKFRDFQFDRNQEEDRQNHLTKQQSRARRVGVPIEKHAEKIYTRQIHKKFQHELFEAGAFTITSKSPNGLRFTVVHADELKEDAPREYKVLLTGQEKVVCSCGLQEHAGLLCRHILKVLVHLDRHEIPTCNIKDRWTMTAGPEQDNSKDIEAMDHMKAQAEESKRRVLVMKALELSQREGPIDDDAFDEVLRAMNKMVGSDGQRYWKVGDVQTSLENQTAIKMGSVDISCPDRPKVNGRPRNNSLKSWNKHNKLEKDMRREVENEGGDGDTVEEQDSRTKTRRLSDLLQVS